MGLVLYLLVFRPLRSSTPLARVVASLGLFLYFQEVVRLRFPTAGAAVIQRFPVLPETRVELLGTAVSANRLWLVVLAGGRGAGARCRVPLDPVRSRDPGSGGE